MTVSVTVTVVGLLAFGFVLGAAIWALRFQRRQYPRGSRTGWSDGRSGAAGWFATKFTWLSGGRG